MNKKEYSRIITLYKAGGVPEKLAIEMILHKIFSKEVGRGVSFDEAIRICSIRISQFYREEVLIG